MSSPTCRPSCPRTSCGCCREIRPSRSAAGGAAGPGRGPGRPRPRRAGRPAVSCSWSPPRTPRLPKRPYRIMRPLLPKPDRPRSSPAKVGIRAGRGRLGVVRGCPQETGHDRCECTLVARPVRPTPYSVAPLAPNFDRRARPVLVTTRVVGKPQTRRGSVFRSRPVADASGAPVLRDQGPIGGPGTARPIKALIPLHAIHGSRRERCSRALALVMARSRLSAWDRCCPLVSPGSCPNHAPGAVELGTLIRLPAASKPTTPTTLFEHDYHQHPPAS
jgi:hypothetical protein